MRKWMAEIQAARRRRAVEQVLSGLHTRGQLVLAVSVQGAYERIYVPCAYGVMMLSPGTAAMHLKAITDQEFERALTAR